MEENKKQAFPTLFHNQTTGEPNGHDAGMTLRDYLAAKAMQSVLVSGNYDNFTGNSGMPVPEFVAEQSYQIADAMLKQREL